MPGWLSAILTPEAAVIVAVLVGLGVVVKKAWPVVRKIVRLVDDMTGVEARPGFDRQPGLMERVKTVEDSVSALTGSVSSLGDSVSSLDKQVQRLDKKLDHHLVTAEGR